MSENSGLFRTAECQCCHRVRETAVCCSPFGAISHAYCRECLAKPAEVRVVFDYLYDEVAQGDPATLPPEMRNWYTWIDGRYVHWNTYVHMRQQENRPND